jgi:hypothetical protein
MIASSPRETSAGFSIFISLFLLLFPRSFPNSSPRPLSISLSPPLVSLHRRRPSQIAQQKIFSRWQRARAKKEQLFLQLSPKHFGWLLFFVPPPDSNCIHQSIKSIPAHYTLVVDASRDYFTPKLLKSDHYKFLSPFFNPFAVVIFSGLWVPLEHCGLCFEIGIGTFLASL